MEKWYNRESSLFKSQKYIIDLFSLLSLRERKHLIISLASFSCKQTWKLISFHFKSKWSKTRTNILICDTWISLQLFNSLLSSKVSKISSTLSYNYHIIHYHNYVCNINVLRSISTCMSEITWHEFQHKKKNFFLIHQVS